MNILTITNKDFETVLSYLHIHPSHMAVLKVRKNFLSERKEIICSNPVFYNSIDIPSARDKIDCFSEIALTSSDYAKAGYLPLMINLSFYSNYLLAKKCFSQIIVENSLSPGIFSGVLYFQDSFEPIHILNLQGPGMKRLVSYDGNKLKEKNSRKDYYNETLNFCLIGTVVKSSLLALNLYSMGIRSFSFIDRDLHKTDFTGHQEQDKSLNLFAGNLFAGSVMESEALNIMRKSDMIISMADNDVDRFWINVVSVYFMKPLLDICDERLDMKLCIPGEGCLFCRSKFIITVELLKDLYRELKRNNRNVIEEEKKILDKNEIYNNKCLYYGFKLLKNFMSGQVKNSIWMKFVEEQKEPVNMNFKRNDCPFCNNM